mmetsp:Transcript_1969/g.4035  ORF Transcript_1969/g.4035 Transcript_1969/m.4035 type:complete len:459 (-) Transcript_1969:233-1609(-)
MGSGKSKAKEAEARRVAEEARLLQEQEQQQQALHQQQQEQQRKEREEQEREQKEREQQEQLQREREQQEREQRLQQQKQEALLEQQQQHARLEQQRLEERRNEHRPGMEEVVAEEDSPPRDTGKAARARNDSPQEIQPVHQNNEELPMSRADRTPPELDGRSANPSPKAEVPKQEETLALDTDVLRLSSGTSVKETAKVADTLQPLGPPKLPAELPALGVGGGGNFGRPSLPGLTGAPKAPGPLIRPGGRLAEPMHKGPAPDRLIAEIEALAGSSQLSEQSFMDEAASLNLGTYNHNPGGSAAAPNRRGPGSVHSHVSVNGPDATISATGGGSSRDVYMNSVSAVQFDHMGSRSHNDPSSLEPELVYPSQNNFSQEEQRRKRSIPGFDNEAFRRANQKTKSSWSDPAPKVPTSSSSAARNVPDVNQVTSMSRAALDRKDEDLMDAIELSLQEESFMGM